MATTYVSLQNLQRYDTNLKTYIDSAKTKSIKAIAVSGNEINFFCDPAPTTESTPDFTVDFPVEYFLDQAKTVLVQEFAWSAETYPGSTDPSLEGKPVLVLAVKGDDEAATVTYSFLNMESLIDIYEGEATNSITVTVTEDNKIKADVKVSAEDGNILSIKEDGLYAEAVLDISGKADKLVDPEEGDPVVKAGQILIDDGTGNIAGSGKTIAEMIEENFTEMSDSEIDDLFA